MIFSTVALEDLKRAGVTSKPYLMFKPAKLAELVRGLTADAITDYKSETRCLNRGVVDI